ncbi:MAG TPA: hypothetical protein VFF89_06650 [Sphingobium sp.]|nr:hypothetical protein [Sphingobium sp.]
MIKAPDPEIVEEWKWRGVPIWSHDGIVCTARCTKAVVKMTSAKGAALDDSRPVQRQHRRQCPPSHQYT